MFLWFWPSLPRRSCPPSCTPSWVSAVAGALSISGFRTRPQLIHLGGLCSVVSRCEQFLIYYSLLKFNLLISRSEINLRNPFICSFVTISTFLPSSLNLSFLTILYGPAWPTGLQSSAHTAKCEAERWQWARFHFLYSFKKVNLYSFVPTAT